MKKQTFDKKNFSEIFATATEDVPRVSTYGKYCIYTCVDIKGSAQIVVTIRNIGIREVPIPVLRVTIKSDGKNMIINSLNICGEFAHVFISYIEDTSDSIENTSYTSKYYIFKDWDGINKAMERFCDFLNFIQKSFHSLLREY